jgi:peptidoglycan/LPS O-acetylase OafA/YrhL
MNAPSRAADGSASAASEPHLAALDGLRGLAILLVVWFHVWEITWLRADVPVFGRTLNFNWIAEDGFAGVDLFFFISGFCLFLPYVRTLFDGRPPQRLGVFAYRRFVKIVPSYVFAIALIIGFGWAKFASPGDEFKAIGLHLLFIHTFWDDSYGSINGVLWSLGTEVQFYVVFPLVCAAALRKPLATFAALACIAAGYRIAVAGDADVVYRISRLPGALDLFGSGMLCAYAYRRIATRAPRLAARRLIWTLVALAGFGAFGALLGSVYQARLFPEWPSAWLVYGRSGFAAAFFIATLGTLFAVPLWQRILGNRLLVFLASISYNLYLWHQPLANALLVARIPGWSGAAAHDDPVWGLRFTMVALATGVAIATFVTFAIERPLMRRRSFERRGERGPALVDAV